MTTNPQADAAPKRQQRQRFSQHRMATAIQVAKANGLAITQTVIAKDGSITLFHAGAQNEPQDALAEWKAKRADRVERRSQG